MNRVSAFWLAVGCLLSAGPAAHADLITYHFAPTAPQIFFENGTFSAIHLTTHVSGVMPSNGGTISTYFAATSLGSSPTSVSMPIDLSLRDSANSSPQVQLGTLSGWLWHNGEALSFTSTPASINFDGNTYKFTSLPLFQTPQGILGITAGRLSFSVSVSPDSQNDPPPGGGKISSVGAPEPSALLLAGIGVPLLAFFRRRRRRG